MTDWPRLFHFERDLHIPEIDLWLDSKRVKPFGFVSHAHTDHLARHKKILCTPPTAEFVQQRIKPTHYQPVEFGQELSVGDYKISLHPAGHILGSAQIKIQKNGISLLYTGDFRLHPSRTVEPFEYVQADVLIMETTFGQARYRMPSREEVEDRLIDRCKTLLAKDKTPIIFAYSLGKGQEALKILTDAQIPVAVEEQIARYVPTYEKFGVTFGHYELFDRNNLRGKALLLPVNYRFHRFYKMLSFGYTIYLSGWGMEPNAHRRFGVNEVIPLSDHADYHQLLELADALKPQEIYCTHGFPQFVEELRAAGHNARTLEEASPLQHDL
ncbi:MBL fold metallo-hydrolase RNA specificity domain-containing protein [Caldithrix abyssi]